MSTKPATASPQQSARDFEQLRDVERPRALGFSARLNLLWDLSATVPALNDGRVISLLAINPNWRESEVRGWLQRDVLPERDVLYQMVLFLVQHLEEAQDPLHWEAFLIYGPSVVSSPVEPMIYRRDRGRRHIASLILSEVVDRYRIAPSNYDAEAAFQRCLTLMYKFNIYEFDDFQPGHLEPFRHSIFPLREH